MCQHSLTCSPEPSNLDDETPVSPVEDIRSASLNAYRWCIPSLIRSIKASGPLWNRKRRKRATTKQRGGSGGLYATER